MPIYEYRCTVCGETTEVLVRSTMITPLCPGCGNPLTNKLFSVPNILTGRTQRQPEHACCGKEELCDAQSCSCEGDCQHY